MRDSSILTLMRLNSFTMQDFTWFYLALEFTLNEQIWNWFLSEVDDKKWLLHENFEDHVWIDSEASQYLPNFCGSSLIL